MLKALIHPFLPLMEALTRNLRSNKLIPWIQSLHNFMYVAGISAQIAPRNDEMTKLN
jgi:hypothetical protein